MNSTIAALIVTVACALGSAGCKDKGAGTGTRDPSGAEPKARTAGNEGEKGREGHSTPEGQKAHAGHEGREGHVAHAGHEGREGHVAHAGHEGREGHVARKAPGPAEKAAARNAPVAFDKAPPVGTRAKCPVMGTVFRVSKETQRSTYQGKHYVFCCPGCKPGFDKNPEKYLSTPAKKG